MVLILLVLLLKLKFQLFDLKLCLFNLFIKPIGSLDVLYFIHSPPYILSTHCDFKGIISFFHNMYHNHYSLKIRPMRCSLCL